MTRQLLILRFTLVAVLVVPFLSFGFLSVRIVEPRLLAEFEAQIVTSATGVQQRVDHFIRLFGGLETLRDVEPVLDSARVASPGLSFLALTDNTGKILYISADNPGQAQIEIYAAGNQDKPVAPDRLEKSFQRSVGAVQLSSVLITPQSNLVKGFNLSETRSGQQAGMLYAGIDINALDLFQYDIWIETGVLILAIVLIALECLLLMFSYYFTRPAWMIEFLSNRLKEKDIRFTVPNLKSKRSAAGRLISTMNDAIHKLRHGRTDGLATWSEIHAPSLDYIRFPLFLFFISEALLRPILPHFLETFSPPGTTSDFIIGVVMASFMGASLISVLLGSILAERAVNVKALFLIGALFSTLGMFGHIFSGNFSTILISRVLTGFGYGIVYAASQMYVAQHSDPSRRTSGFSLFLSVIVAAEIVGPAIGGILADHVGQIGLITAATMVIPCSMILAIMLLPRTLPKTTNPKLEPKQKNVGQAHRKSFSDISMSMSRTLLHNPRFLITTVFFALPAKALLTGGLFLLVPLVVYSQSGTAIETSRVLMGYGIGILLLSSLIASLADRSKHFLACIVAGGVLAGIAFVIPHSWAVFGQKSQLILFLSILIFGCGQSFSIPAQLSFLMTIMRSEILLYGSGAILGIFRFIERLGSLAGPLIAGSLLIFCTPGEALMWMGLCSILLSSLGMCIFFVIGEIDEEEVVRGLIVEA